MDAYLARTSTGIIAVRATSDAMAKEMLKDQNPSKVVRLNPSVADAMKIPPKEGIYADAVWQWVAGPTNILGELL